MPILPAALLAFGVLLVVAPTAVRLTSPKSRKVRDSVRRVLSRVQDLSQLLRDGRVSKAWRVIAGRLYSNSTSIGLRRDLTIPFAGANAKIPITVRPLADTDDLSSLDPEPGLPADAAYSRLVQRRLLRSGLRTCYVAIAPDGKPCYMQWAIPPTENDQVRAVFGNLYPVLGPDEALLEGAYTPDNYRGKGIMGAAMAEIAERAADLGARWVVTFVDEANQASFKGCIRAGFAPYLKRYERFRLFYRQVRFERIEPGEAPAP
jgi:GNAT superfamily N-acetyltransferase